MSFSSSSTHDTNTTVTIHTRRRPRVQTLFLLFGDPSRPSSNSNFPKSALDDRSKQDDQKSHHWWPRSLPRIRSTSRSPPPSILTAPMTIPSLPSNMPLTPTPSINSQQQRIDALKSQVISRSSLYEDGSPIAGPSKTSYGPPITPTSPTNLPHTPPALEDPPSFIIPSQTAFVNFADVPAPPPRPSRARRPASVYPFTATENVFQPRRKYTDPSSRPFYPTQESPNPNTPDQQLDVDLDAYSTTEDDGEDGTKRDHTLSFVTSSTVDSTTSTPSMSGSYGFKPVTPDGKPSTEEPRIRVRSTTGRANAYSSAESSTASGAFYGYDNHIYHPHPPPLPTGPIAYNQHEEVGLGIGLPSASPEQDQSPRSIVSPNNSFSYKPWRHNVVNRLRSDSAASSLASSETSETPSVEDSGYSYRSYNYATGGRLPWEMEGDSNEPAALALVEEGKERILDGQRLEALGGIQSLTADAIKSLSGVTHLLLSSTGSALATVLPNLLAVLAPTLVVVDFSCNDLSSLPDSLKDCASLEELNLSENPLRQVPAWISELSNLRVLQVDGCRLQNLPAEIGNLSKLHTLCFRRNRLVALPSWLCLLGRLETLRVEDNPFAHGWASIVAPILPALLTTSSATTPLSSQFDRMALASSAQSLASSTTVNSSYAKDSPAISVDQHEAEQPWTSAPVSSNNSTQHLGLLDPIAEDHPHSAPPNGTHNMETDSVGRDETMPSRRIRRMQSAGALLFHNNINNNKQTASPPTSSPEMSTDPVLAAFGVNVSPSREEQTSSVLLPPRAGRFASVSSGGSRRSASAMGNYAVDEDDSGRPSSSLTSSTNGTKSKEGKWGFLRKMSMSRLKMDKSHTNLTASAQANLKLMPPLVHANSDPAPAHAQLHRPGMNPTAKSALTLPTRKALGDAVEDINEFGQPTQPVKVHATTLGPNGLPVPELNATGVRGKRRSFLPIDAGPPLLNIHIPSVSPFMPHTSIFEYRDAVSLNDAAESNSEGMETLVESPTQITVVPPSASTQLSSLEQEAKYAAGLVSIKSYLRDLYDLSRSPIEQPYGGFEVVGSSGEGSYANSSGSDRAASPLPAMIGRGSVSETRRARRPTLNSGISRNESTVSTVESEHGFGENSTESSGKRFKDDRTKRARVIREIYETERTYVRGLGELVSIYVRPAASPVNPGKPNGETVIPVAERKIVFGGVESILTIHRDNFLSALEKAVKPLLEGTDDEEGLLSAQAAHNVGDVFRTYIAYMKQYSSYINNFDNALSRMQTWTAATTPGHSVPGTPAYGKVNSPGSHSIASAAVSAGMSAAVLPMADTPHSGSPMSTSQKKRVKTFLKRSREHPRHSQINLESYLLLPVQRIPRYKLLLEDLAMCTPPQTSGPSDTLDEALGEISTLAATMNEEKRDAESRLRLFHWQQRISSRGPSPLVQPHRKLVLDGAVTLIRLVKKAVNFVEIDVDQTSSRPGSLGRSGDGEGDHTIGPGGSKVVVQVETLAPEPMDRPMMMILCSDLMVLVQQRGEGWEGTVDLFNVLRMATVREPASVMNGTTLRVVDNKSIYYFNGGSVSNTLQWCRAINQQSRR